MTRLAIILVVVLILLIPVALLNLLVQDDEKRPMEYLREVLATPHRVIQENLGLGEKVLKWSRPAITAYLWRQRRFSLQTFATGVLWVVVASIAGPVHPFGLLAFLIFDVHILILIYRRVEDLYTLYVFTDRRVMRLSGVFNRDQASIDWPRVVDFSWQQAFLGRLLGFATLRVDSASENAKFKEMRDIPGRFKINQLMVDQLARHERA